MGGGVRLYRRAISKIKTVIREQEINHKKSKKQCALVTNNCLAGFLYHDFGMEFITPTINLQMNTDTFIEFCMHLPESLDWKIEEVKDLDVGFFKRFQRDKPFPVGKFKSGEIYFQHYHSFEEAISAWNRRSIRLKEWMSQGKQINIVITCREISDEDYSAFKK